MIRKVINSIRQMQYKRFLGSVGEGFGLGKSPIIINPQSIYIGSFFRAGNNLKLQAWPSYRGAPTGFESRITIGNNVSFMDNVQLTAVDHISIGNGVLLGDNVFIGDNGHGSASDYEDRDIPPLERHLSCKGGITVGDNVWIGRNVCVLGNVSIGNGSIIGANSVVTRDIPPYSTAVGVPAKVIDKRSIL